MLLSLMLDAAVVMGEANFTPNPKTFFVIIKKVTNPYPPFLHDDFSMKGGVLQIVIKIPLAMHIRW